LTRFNAVVLVLAVCLGGCATPVPEAPAREPAQTRWENRWEPAIQRFEKQDEKDPPPKGATLFVGSSSIVFWNLEQYFPGMQVINRGFGGSFISDSVYFVDRIVIKHRPKTVVFFAGGNDIAAGKTAETVANDFKEFVAKVHSELPETRILVIAIKPSIARWHLVDTIRDANARVEAFTKTVDRVEFVDVFPAMIGDDGTVRTDLFVKDGLHLNDKGYALWASILMPHLSRME
jgi:lysophospholipase L1-like esterase